MDSINYDYYSNVYRGSVIPKEEFPKYIRKGTFYVEGLIFGRDPGEWAESVKLAICNVAELLYLDETRLGITGENCDGYSVSYAAGDLAKNIADAASVYLADSGLLYAGGR